MTNIIFGWQSTIMYDCDPDNEPTIFGSTPDDDEFNAHCNVTNGADLSFICLEAIRDFSISDLTVDADIAYTITHEMGHQFGLTHGFFEDICDNDCSINCANVGIMTSVNFNVFEPKFIKYHINLLRSRKKSPKS